MARTPRSTRGRPAGRKAAATPVGRSSPSPAADGPPSPTREAGKRSETARPSTTRRIVLTGAAGFIGGAVARVLRERGDAVVALVRDRRRAANVDELGVEIVEDDLAEIDRLADAFRGADAVIHAAGMYRIGIPRAARGAMWDANVGTTTRVLDAAEDAGTPRIVHVSTVNVFGNTHGRVVDESYRRDLAEGFVSWYDETKYGAHEVAEQRIRDGAPIVIAMPSQVYGPRDHSEIGERLRAAYDGSLRYAALDDVGFGLVHVHDLADGVVAALDRGQAGRPYVLSGPTTTLRDATAIAARIGGRTPPALRVPTAALSLIAPLGSIIGRPNLREVIAASAGVTYWASSGRAREELGWEPRDIETGLRDTFGLAARSAGSP
ncbi:MAG: NAD-dependent epimerase/dehydratase family protein [Chloroflexota bacterium]